MLKVIIEDITTLEVDAIVNAANKSLLGGSGVDGAIHNAAGPQLLEFNKTLGGCETGEAKIAPGFNLPAKYIIHTVGPIYLNSENDSILLENCYNNSLNLAVKNNLKSIAFPSISTGVYGYPIKEAAKVAVGAIKKWLSQDNQLDIILCCFDQNNYDAINEELRNQELMSD